MIINIENDEFGEMVRRAMRSDEISLFRKLLPQQILQTMDEMIDDPAFLGATDAEASSLLSMIVSINKPKKILELGTFLGFSSLLFGGILTNYSAQYMIYTVERAEEIQNKAKYYVEKAGLLNNVKFIKSSSIDSNIVNKLVEYGPFDFIYIDSSHIYKNTSEELKIYVEDERFTNASTLVVLHDAGESAKEFDSSGEGGVPRALKEWINFGENKEKFQLFIFEPPMYPNPCGLALIRRKSLIKEKKLVKFFLKYKLR